MLDKEPQSPIMDDIDVTNTPYVATTQLANPNAFSSNTISVVSVQDLRAATNQDETLQDLMSAIINGFPATHSLTSTNIQAIVQCP